MPNNRPPFPIALDSTIVKTFKDCPQKAFLEYFHHYKPKLESTHLLAGKAFAAGLESYRARWLDTHSHESAMIAGVRSLTMEYGTHEPNGSATAHVKTWENMVCALDHYFTQAFPMAQDQFQIAKLDGENPAIEITFAVPIGVPHPTSGDDILWVGRLDAAVELGGQKLYGLDDKTTGSIGAAWPNQWKLRSQFTGYTWALQSYGFPVNGILVRGIAIQKTQYNHAQVVVDQPDWKIARWLHQTRRDIRRMIATWEEGYWDWDLGDACTAYGGCPFMNACNARDPRPWLESDFQQRVWNPLEVAEENPLTTPIKQN